MMWKIYQLHLLFHVQMLNRIAVLSLKNPEESTYGDVSCLLKLKAGLQPGMLLKETPSQLFPCEFCKVL